MTIGENERIQVEQTHIYLTWLLGARSFRRHREAFTSGKAEVPTFVGVFHVSLSVVHLIPHSVFGAVGNMLSYWKVGKKGTVYQGKG